MEALFVVYRCYKQEFMIKKDDLMNVLIATLENQMFELAAEEGEELNDSSLSGRAHWLVRKLLATGWIEMDSLVHSVDEYIAVPDYSVKILQVLYEISEDKPREYNSLVYSTYSNLSKAQEERGDYLAEALMVAYGLTDRLVDSLKSLLNNMRSYYLALQEQEEVREVLRQHFDRYQVLISDKIYHPLKTFDSVPRFRTRILSVLREWLVDGELLEKISEQLFRKGRFTDKLTAYDETIRMITFIIDQYEKMDQLLREIDRKNTGYTRASVERTQYLLNANRDTKGQLIEVIKALPRIHGKLPLEIEDDLGSAVSLFDQHWVDNNSLYRQQRKRVFSEPEPINSNTSLGQEEFEAEFDQIKRRVQDSLTHKKVMDFMKNVLKDQNRVRAYQLELEATEDFLKLILGVINADEKGVPYRITFEDGYLLVNGFRIPDLTIENKGGDNDVD
ncbi:MAG: Wadjet anti-phage system protein JetA family protein [Bacillota bacterium]